MQQGAKGTESSSAEVSNVCAASVTVSECVVLLQYVQNDSPSSKSLAGLVVQLLQFQEDAFGRRVNNPALTKLPVGNTHLNTMTTHVTQKCEGR